MSSNISAKPFAGAPWGNRNRLVREKNDKINKFFLRKRLTIVDRLDACGWWRHVFAASTSPRSGPNKLAMSRSSTVHSYSISNGIRGAGINWGCSFEPARIRTTNARRDCLAFYQLVTIIIR